MTNAQFGAAHFVSSVYAREMFRVNLPQKFESLLWAILFALMFGLVGLLLPEIMCAPFPRDTSVAALLAMLGWILGYDKGRPLRPRS